MTCILHLSDFFKFLCVKKCFSSAVIGASAKLSKSMSAHQNVFENYLHYLSIKTQVLGTHKNCLNETIFLSTQSKFKLMG